MQSHKQEMLGAGRPCPVQLPPASAGRRAGLPWQGMASCPPLLTSAGTFRGLRDLGQLTSFSEPLLLSLGTGGHFLASPLLDSWVKSEERKGKAASTPCDARCGDRGHGRVRPGEAVHPGRLCAAGSAAACAGVHGHGCTCRPVCTACGDPAAVPTASAPARPRGNPRHRAAVGGT